MAKQEKIIIAHRGASAYETENTLESFRKAIELKADVIEIDVRKTKDNILIAFHNSRLNTMLIRDLTYKQIQKQTKFHIPTLEEVIILSKNKIKIDIDIKEKGYEQDITKILLKSLSEKDFIITSEHPDSIKIIKENNQSIKTGLILKKSNKNNLILFLSLNLYPKKRIKESKADFIVPDWRLLTKKFIKNAEQDNKKILPWSIENKKLAERLLKEKAVAGIITNKPDFID